MASPSRPVGRGRTRHRPVIVSLVGAIALAVALATLTIVLLANTQQAGTNCRGLNEVRAEFRDVLTLAESQTPARQRARAHAFYATANKRLRDRPCPD